MYIVHAMGSVNSRAQVAVCGILLRRLAKNAFAPQCSKRPIAQAGKGILTLPFGKMRLLVGPRLPGPWWNWCQQHGGELL